MKIISTSKKETKQGTLKEVVTKNTKGKIEEYAYVITKNGKVTRNGGFKV